jgi:CBS domain-containing protein
MSTSTTATATPLRDLVHDQALRVVTRSMCLRDAAATMAEDGIGVLLVAGTSSGMIGIISERDIITAIANDADLESERIGDFMSDEVVTIELDASLATATSVMVQALIRHLVVVDRDGEVVGIVSSRDILAKWAASVADTMEVST